MTRYMPNTAIALTVALLTALAMISLASPAQADLLISPLRVVMDDGNRNATLTLRNTSSGARTYRLGWVEQRMDEAGIYHPVEPSTPGHPGASDMIRFSPRQITVGPGENQTVRLSYRPPAGLAAGEYRSHLLFQVLPDVSEPSGTFEVDGGADGISMQLFMQMSFSLPVIVRQAVSAPALSIADVAVQPAEQGKPMGLGVTLRRTGDSSSFGRIVVEAQVDERSPVELIGVLNDIAVFTEAVERRVTVPLRDTTIPSGAWIRVAYEGTQEYQGRVWDERIFQNR